MTHTKYIKRGVKMKVIKEIKIRNINAATLNRIDQLAQQSGISRNSYLLKQLDFLSITEPIKDIETNINNNFNAVFTLLLQQQEDINEIKRFLQIGGNK